MARTDVIAAQNPSRNRLRVHRLSARELSSLERPLPQNLDAERSILGAILLDNHALNPAVERLRPDDFFLDQHRRVFQQMMALGETQRAIDLVTLTDELHRRGELEGAGGAPYLAALVDGVPRVANIEHYARIVKEKAVLRNLIHATHAIEQRAFDADEDADTIVASAVETLQAAGQDSASRLVATSAEELLALDIKPREMLLDPFLPQQGLGLLYGFRGTGKTFLAAGIGAAVASGRSFLRWTAVKPRSVVFVDGELPAKTLQERAAMILGDMDARPAAGALRFITPDFQSRPMPDLATPAGQALLEPHLVGCDLVIIDNLSALCRAGVENEGESWVPVQDWALRLRRRGISVLFVHHAGWSRQNPRGTSRREDLLDFVIALRQPLDYHPSEGLRVEVHFEKTRGMLGDGAKPFEVRLETGPHGRAVWTMREPDGARLDDAATLFAEGLSVRQVARELGISKSTAGRFRAQWQAAPSRCPSVPGVPKGDAGTPTHQVGQDAGTPCGTVRAEGADTNGHEPLVPRKRGIR